MEERGGWLRPETADLVEKAYHDALTGILNRRAAEERITGLMERGGACIMGDINGLKQINDACGHPEGDRYLKFAADTLKNQARESDVVGRIGGDEFLVFLTGCNSLEGAKRYCGRVNRAFDAFNGQRDGGPELGMAFGVTLCREGDTCASLYGRADRLLMENKRRIHAEAVPLALSGRAADLNRICGELSGEASGAGALFLSYEAFCGVCRFLNRNPRRDESSRFLLLFTLKPEAGPPGKPSGPESPESRMSRLGGLLGAYLRAGDACTRCSGCQYLALVCCSREEAVSLSGRVLKAFPDGLETDLRELRPDCAPQEAGV